MAPHTAVFEADINMFGVSHFSLIGVDIIREGDAFHCEKCDHILIHDVEFDGGTGAHETVKVNQSQHVWIEDSDIHGADDNAIDFVAVQYGHVTGTKIHDAQDWCVYAKGGSVYITFSANEVYDCGTGGITAGQGTGFEFMVAPWINYEAYGIEILDNVIHDVEGAGLGVAGGYGIVIARNTLYSVGSRSHVVEFVHGRRGCDGTVDLCRQTTMRAVGVPRHRRKPSSRIATCTSSTTSSSIRTACSRSGSISKSMDPSRSTRTAAFPHRHSPTTICASRATSSGTDRRTTCSARETDAQRRTPVATRSRSGPTTTSTRSSRTWSTPRQETSR